MPKKHKGKQGRAGKRSQSNPTTPHSQYGHSPAGRSKFLTMAEEARETERHQWSPYEKLRDRGVVFVSSGSMDPSKTDKPGDDDIGESESESGVHHKSRYRNGEKSGSGSSEDDAVDFVIDTVGDSSVTIASHPKLKRAQSPTPSDSSSDDVVVFQGRHRPQVLDDPIATQHTKRPPSPRTTPIPVEKPHVADALMTLLNTKVPISSCVQDSAQDEQTSAELTPAVPETKPKPTESGWAYEHEQEIHNGWAYSRPRFREHPVKHWVHADGTEGLNPEDVPSDLEAKSGMSEQPKALRGPRSERTSRRKQKSKDEIDDAILQDYIDNMSDSNNFNVPKAELGGGTEWVTASSDDDLDITIEVDGSDDDESEDSDLSSIDIDVDDPDGDDSDLEDMIERAERERWEDDDDLRQRQVDAMSDEQLARLIAKQEALGISTDDLALFDDTGFGDIDAARKGLELYTSRSRKPNTDPYGDFDIMDYDRPSLQPRKKNTKSSGKPHLALDGLSDEDLIAELENSWATDRRSKRLKKAEREDLRAQGLLGRKSNGKPNLAMRYPEGISFADLKIELQEFLECSHTTKAMPPMGKDERKVLHQIAQVFGLNSKSRGVGKDRFTVLVKKQRTLQWSEKTWSMASRNGTRNFLPNPKASGKGKSKSNGGGRGGGGGGAGGAGAGTSYRHGEVVGASAPEISADNFGRKLMEKMGWAKGMALGKAREGEDVRLLVPVQATIKSGRGGLG